MVLLGLSFSLLKQFPKGADRGLYAGKGIMHQVKVTFSNKKTKRTWHPNVQRKAYYSDILETTMKLRVTTAAMRCIDKAGGFDAYIYHTPEHKLNSRLGVALKQRMCAVLSKYPQIEPPHKAKRLPRAPKSLHQTDQSLSESVST